MSLQTSLRLGGLLAVLALAALGLLYVVGLIEAAQLKTYAIRALGVILIIAVASAVTGFLLKKTD